MSGMLAETAFASADTLNVSLLRFYPETCLSGHDNNADIWRLRQSAVDEAVREICGNDGVHTLGAGQIATIADYFANAAHLLLAIRHHSQILRQLECHSLVMRIILLERNPVFAINRAQKLI